MSGDHAFQCRFRFLESSCFLCFSYLWRFRPRPNIELFLRRTKISEFDVRLFDLHMRPTKLINYKFGRNFMKLLFGLIHLIGSTRPKFNVWQVPRKILTGSRNLGSVFDKSRSLVFAWFVFTVFESRNFLPKSLGLGFLTRVSGSRRVSDFTIRHP